MSLTRETWAILGATSSMARAFARAAAAEGADILLCGRDMDDMARTAADLRVACGVEAETFAWDARDPDTHRLLASALAAREGVLCVACFAASMPEQAEIDDDPDLAAGVFADGLVGVVSTLHRIAPEIERRGAGTVIALGSVAGDRGRIKNYVYGAAKAGLHAYLSGLRNRLGRAGAHVMTVKPGFVDTAMTWDAEGMFLVAAPEDAAAEILSAARKRRDVLYTPWFWRWIMAIIRAIPERVFKRMSI